MKTLLELDGFGVAFGEKVILADVDLSIPARGMTVLMGPAAAGKSTLVRTLAGVNDAQPAMRTWGRARYAGHPLGKGDRPALVAQKARLVMATVEANLALGLADRSKLTARDKRERIEAMLRARGLEHLVPLLDEQVVGLPVSVQRQVAILRTATAEPGLLCVDEPCASLTEEEAAPIMRLLADEAETRALLVISHHHRFARRLGGQVALLAGGRIVAADASDDFFERPVTEAARTFVRTGSLSLPSPGASPEHLDPDGPEPTPIPAEGLVALERRGGPRGFHWVWRGRLAGTPRPGLIGELEHDLAALADIGITTLVCLEETQTVSAVALAGHGMASVHFPVDDMQAPDIDRALELCAEVERRIADGEIVAYHCRAGLGRTGTLLAAQLIFAGGAPLETLESIRLIQPRWVQSTEQVQFLEQFGATVLRRLDTPGPMTGP